MIIYRKAPHLRIERFGVPAPPFWPACTIAPYSSRRATPVSIDYLDLRAGAAEKLEVVVCENVREELERATLRQRLGGPALIDATGIAERVFSRGGEALRFCESEGTAAIHLVSTEGSLPESVPPGTIVVLAAWPPDRELLLPLAQEAAARELAWGIAVPVVYPITTDLATLGGLAAMAKGSGCRFLAAVPVEIEAVAKQAIVRMMNIAEGDDAYNLLFHSDLEPIHTATERHIAALASEIGIADFVVPPRWERRSNWNAAVLLTLIATRMLAMGHEVELASTLSRSARIIATLDKPIDRIAEAASLAIIEGLDEISVDLLTEWIGTGRSAFADAIGRQWRLRRDHGISEVVSAG
ncbi:MAG TPA: hypothetical protein VEZ11_13865 [Thermoanaerobaculia bacterium]|nr:hypothetical protein [Thermoanaerobaculia bacterium]